MAAPSVCVVGLGAMGSMSLWQLARRGASVTGLEQFGIPHDRGGYAGESRIFRAAYLEGPEYVPWLMRAREAWIELERESGERLFYQTGFLSMGSPHGELITGTLASAQQHGLPHDVLDAGQCRRRFPQHELGRGEVAVLDKLGGVLRPERAVAAAVQRAVEMGAKVHSYTPVRDLAVRRDKAVVVTDHSSHSYDHVIVCAGAWTGGLPTPAAVAIQPMTLYLCWFFSRDTKLFFPDLFPAFIRKSPGMEDLRLGIAGFPSLDRLTVKVGESVGGSDPVDDPDHLPRTMPAERIRSLSEIVRAFLPLLHPDPVRTGTYVDGFSPDGRPIVIHSPRITVLAGFSGHGFKLAPAFASLAAGLAVGDQPPADAAGIAAFVESGAGLQDAQRPLTRPDLNPRDAGHLLKTEPAS